MGSGRGFLSSVDRRTFLKACGIFGVGAVAGGALQAASKVVRLDGRLLKIAQTRVAMGTYVTINVVDDSRTRAEQSIGRAFEEMDRLIAIFNRYDGSTAVSTLNANGSLPGSPPELVSLIARSIELHRSTRTAFDITVKPVVDLFRTHGPAGGPSRSEIDASLELVGVDGIRIVRDRIDFDREGMGITLDGIAKGHIVDRMSETLAASGAQRHLINAGGDIRTSGVRRDGRPWTVAIQDPQKNGNFPGFLEMTHGAVATSGSYEIYFDDQRVHHHIVDPDNGSSPHHSVSVTVRAPSVAEADALSTAVFVLPQTAGLGLIESLHSTEAFVVDHTGAMRRTSGWSTDAA
jgi:thiamine biosynthesis lipoprotein